MFCTTRTIGMVVVAPVMYTDLPNDCDVNGVIEKTHSSRVGNLANFWIRVTNQEKFIYVI